MKIIKVARAAFGTLNVTCTNNITIPNVGSHGYEYGFTINDCKEDLSKYIYKPNQQRQSSLIEENMKKNYYKISTYILGLLLVITLFFLFDATKNPPSIIGAFSNNTALSDNVNIGFAVKRANGYRLYFQGKEFDHGIYKKSSDNAYVLEPKNGANGAIIITNKKSYLYYPKLKEKIIVVQQTTAIKQAAKKVIIWE